MGCLILLLLTACPVAAQNPVAVTVGSLGELSLLPRYDAPATTISVNDARISAETSGVIESISVQVGDIVEKDGPIAQLDCSEHALNAQQAAAGLRAAQAQAQFARSQLRRAQELIKTRAVSTETLNQRIAEAEGAEAEVERQQAVLRSAQRRVTHCQIQAPFQAVVIERIASVGEFATPGMVVVRLLDQEQLEVSGNIQEQDLEGLRKAKSIVFVGNDRTYPLQLRTVIPLVDSRIRSFEARFLFTDQKASPGEAGRVEWVSNRRHLPSELLVERQGQLGVFILAGERARFHAIPQAREGNPAPVDLPESVAIIVAGRFSLDDGVAVQVMEP
ncbi:MAG: efflux RND transporter periplasmic adaptor subunit [Candidatus Competibacteraceae bacterium]|nr:efflux RND transporter periplasmic adaptor subunit [Candidatus Competibacteraceae bacterium]